VKVIPATDEIRKYVKHPTGIKFGKSGPAEWPMDGFTRKRIREGAVKLEGEPAKAAAEKRAPRAS
jgi:hypothetical protein